MSYGEKLCPWKIQLMPHEGTICIGISQSHKPHVKIQVRYKLRLTRPYGYISQIIYGTSPPPHFIADTMYVPHVVLH